MALSNKLVSKFVKATKNDTSNNKKEKIVYGNIVSKEENNKTVYYARIDGAEENVLVPISHFTSSVQADDKVIITIKDHTAIVTGNVKNPSTNDTQVNNIVDEKISDIDIEAIALEDINALWETN